MLCPASMRPHADRVLKGEYALPSGYLLEGVKTIIDIGANVGAFSMWAAKQWPGADVHAYEPSPDNVEWLRRNTKGMKVHVSPYAIGSTAETVTFFKGKNNCGETSRHDLGEQDKSATFTCAVEPARDLPACDVLKVDTEGCELAILEDYLFCRAELPAVVMLEWHRPSDRWNIGALLSSRVYECVRDDVRRNDRGIMIWVQA